jgi:hypothetical protein
VIEDRFPWLTAADRRHTLCAVLRAACACGIVDFFFAARERSILLHAAADRDHRAAPIRRDHRSRRVLSASGWAQTGIGLRALPASMAAAASQDFHAAA